MAGHQLTTNQTGLYEIAIPANVATGITIAPNNGNIQVIVHTAPTPVYIRVGHTAAIKDPNTAIATEGSWVELPLPYMTETTISIISQNAATVSLTRA